MTFTFLAGPAEAAEHLVTTPAELKDSAERAGPGDVILLKDGVWRDAVIAFAAEGTHDKPVTIRAQTPGKVILSGKTRVRFSGKHVVLDGLDFRDGYPADSELIETRTSKAGEAEFCRITNCRITDFNPPSKRTDTKWIGLYGRNNRVDHCTFSGKTNVGTTLVVWVGEKPNDHRIDHNYFGPRPRLGENGGETIRVGTSEVAMNVSRTVVEENLFERCSGEVEIISNKSVQNLYRHNTFIECEGALTLRHGKQCTVDGNWFFGNGKPHTGGVRVIGPNHVVVNNYFIDLKGDGARSALTMMNGIPKSIAAGYYQVKNAVVAFNTFINCDHYFTIGYVGSEDSTLPPADCLIANNLISGVEGNAFDTQTKPLNLLCRSNLVSGKIAVPPIDGFSRGDASLERGADGIWRPSAASAARGLGLKLDRDIPAAAFDIDGQERGEKPDVGCDQGSQMPIRFQPVKKTDVGANFSR